MIWLLIYLVLAVVFLIDMIMSIEVLIYVKQSVNVRERPNLVKKIEELQGLKKYSIIWPYVLYKLLKK